MFPNGGVWAARNPRRNCIRLHARTYQEQLYVAYQAISPTSIRLNLPNLSVANAPPAKQAQCCTACTESISRNVYKISNVQC